MGLKHQAASNRKLRAAIRRAERHLPPYLPPLLFLTDPARTSDPVTVAARLPAGSGVIYRHFGAEDRLCTARSLVRITSERGLYLLIAADPALARTVGAHGVHWPEARLGEARHWQGVFTLNTASAHSPRAIWRAARAGMDAALVSTVFASRSASAGPPMGAGRFRRLATAAPLPLYALGGVNAQTAGRVAGYGGLAAVSAVAESRWP